jgi:hypothetical protein
MNFVLLAWLSFGLGAHYYTRQLVNSILVTVWGARLGMYLLYRVIKRGHDARWGRGKSISLRAMGNTIHCQVVWRCLPDCASIAANDPCHQNKGDFRFAGSTQEIRSIRC